MVADGIPTVPRGRPTLDPGGVKAVRLPGIWVAPDVRARITLLASQLGRPEREARRMALLAGLRALETAQRAAEEQQREARAR